MSFSLKNCFEFFSNEKLSQTQKTYREREETNPNLMLKVVLRHLDPSHRVFSTSDIVVVLCHPDAMHGVISV